MVKTEHAEMLVKGKDMIYAVGFDKGKAGAVGVAQAGEVVFAEDSARGCFGFFRDSQYIDAATLISVHERKGGKASCADIDEGICFGQNKIGGKYQGVYLADSV